jgi:hypothetical protein
MHRQNPTVLRPPNRASSTASLPPRCLYHAPAAMGGRAERTPDSTAGTCSWSAQIGEAAIWWYYGDSKKLLVLFLWRFKLVLCLNYLLQPPAWFEGNLNHLGAGAFEITS